MEVQVYLNFDGNCEEAMKTYEKVFSGKNMEIMRYSDIPDDPNFPIPEDQKNMIIHGEMTIGDLNFNFSDTPGQYVHGNMMSVALRLDTAEEVRTFYEGLREGSTIHIDLGETFFSDLYVFFTDRFGVNWQFVAVKDK